MGALLAPIPVMRFYDNNNNPLAGGQLFTYQAGTTTPFATYTDSTAVTQNPNPVVMDARGEAAVWLNPAQAYKLVLKDANGNTIWTADQITSPAPVAVGNMTDEKGSGGTPGFVANVDFTPGTTTSLTLSTNYGSASNLWVAFDGAEQGADTYSLSGTTLTFNASIPLSTQKVYVKGGTSLAVGTPGVGTVVDSSVSSSSKLYNRINDLFDIRDYGGKGDNTTDNTAAFNAAVTACQAKNGTLYIPAGNYLFNSKPADITSAMEIVGDGLNSTVLIRNYVELGTSTGFLNINGVSGCTIRGLGIDASAVSSGGSLIQALSSSAVAGSIVLEDLWLSTLGSNNLNYIIAIDGSQKTTGALGFRDSAFRNVHVFGANTSISLNCVNGLSWHGGGVYAAGNTGAGSGEIQISGNASVTSNNILIDIYTASTISLSNCANVEIHIPAFSGAITNASSASNCNFVGGTPGSVQQNWVNSMYISPGGYSQGSTNSYNTLTNGKFEITGLVTFNNANAATINFPKSFPSQVESVSFAPNGNTNVFYSNLTLSGMQINTPANFTGSIFYRVSGF